MCVEIDWIFLDVELRPFWRFVKPDCTSVSRVFVAVTLVRFADDRCFRAGVAMISTWPFETVGALTVTAGCIEGVGLSLQVLVIGGGGSSDTLLNVRQSGFEGRL